MRNMPYGFGLPSKRPPPNLNTACWSTRPKRCWTGSTLCAHALAAGPVAVCLEQKHGPLIHALMAHEFLLLYPINPSTLANYRKAFRPRGAINDKNDAELLSELVRCHRDRLSAWQPDDEQRRR
jgi:hypothetical protein